jgi:hypothetical protein
LQSSVSGYAIHSATGQPAALHIQGPQWVKGARSHEARALSGLPSKAAVSNRSKAAPYSITSSARARSVGGTSMPSALAVLRLMTSSYFVVARKRV